MVEVKQKDGESNESLIRRFTRRVQQSGVLLRAKKIRFKEDGKSRDMLRKNAIRRTSVRKKYEYLKKIGKLEEIQPKQRWRRH